MENKLEILAEEFKSKVDTIDTKRNEIKDAKNAFENWQSNPDDEEKSEEAFGKILYALRSKFAGNNRFLNKKDIPKKDLLELLRGIIQEQDMDIDNKLKDITDVKYIRLRYRLLPYIYSMAWRVTSDGYTIMRPLVMDFREDPRVLDIDDQYMFGPAFMVSPVTLPKTPSRKLYLPEKSAYHFSLFVQLLLNFQHILLQN